MENEIWKQTFIEGISVSSKHIGKDVSGNIIACIKGKQPTAYGFKWEYKYDKN